MAKDNGAQSKKPSDTAFKQQRLPAWQPILSPPWVIACFLLVAMSFIPIGVLVIIASGEVVEVEEQYNQLTGRPYTYNGVKFVSDNNVRGRTQEKWVKVDIPKEMKPPIYIYYKLTDFFQNHRRYARSRSDSQLAGDEVSFGGLKDCEPLRYEGEIAGNDTFKPSGDDIGHIYSPCGLIAWSMFNDTFTIFEAPDKAGGGKEDCETDQTKCKLLCEGSFFGTNSSSGSSHQCTKEGIAWDSDVEKKFKDPASGYASSSEDSPRFYWNEGPIREPDNNIEGHVLPLQTDLDFIVWMRTASLPTFRKLYRKFEDTTLAEGTTIYIKIIDRFRTDLFDGKKFVVLSTTTWIGGKNHFLGIAYIVVGSLCGILAMLFIIKHIKSRPPTGH